MLRWLLIAEIVFVLIALAGIALFFWKIAVILAGIVGFLACEKAGARLRAAERGRQ